MIWIDNSFVGRAGRLATYAALALVAGFLFWDVGSKSSDSLEVKKRRQKGCLSSSMLITDRLTD